MTCPACGKPGRAIVRANNAQHPIRLGLECEQCGHFMHACLECGGMPAFGTCDCARRALERDVRTMFPSGRSTIDELERNDMLAQCRAKRHELWRGRVRARRFAWLAFAVACVAQTLALWTGSSAWLAALVGMANGYVLHGNVRLERDHRRDRAARSDTSPS